MPQTAKSETDSAPTAAPAPRLSIVIPAYNAERTLPIVLGALRDRPDDWELIVVDDHSVDATAEIARDHGARVVVSRGVANGYAARNSGGLTAKGRLLAFLDADVEVSVAQLEDMVERFEASDASCFFAVYDRGRHLTSVVSSFKNFWIRHSTIRSPRPPRWINTSLALMRRHAFLEAGTFNEVFSVKRGGGDLFFGRRLSEACGPIVIDESTEVRHHKQFTLLGMLRNDCLRARGWFRLALSRRGLRGVARKPSLANVRRRFSVGVVAAGATGPLLLLGLVHPALALAGAAAAGVQLVLAAPLVLAAARDRVRGWALFVPLLFIDQLACAGAVTLEVLRWSVISPRTRPEFEPLGDEKAADPLTGVQN